VEEEKIKRPTWSTNDSEDLEYRKKTSRRCESFVSARSGKTRNGKKGPKNTYVAPRLQEKEKRQTTPVLLQKIRE